MDIEYLLLLQRLREALPWLAPAMELVSELAASSLTIAAAAFVFWAVDRQFGGFLVLNYAGSSLLIQTLKLTACVYRPWVRDARVLPDPAALGTATGYSFPSGHTQSAASIYGSIGLWYGRRRRWLAALMAAMVLLTAFSRNLLGVHTPQDVLAAIALSGGWLWLSARLTALLAKRPALDLPAAAAGCALALLAVAWFSVKSYPLDYAPGGGLLADPAAMMEDGFMSAGMVFGFWPGWLVERRWVRFSTARRTAAQYALAGVALVPMLLIYKLLPAALAPAAGPHWAEFFSCALLAFYVMAIVPACIRALQRRGERP